MGCYFQADRVSVGYNKEILIRDISFSLEKGSVLTLIGPNGAGKSTILKTLIGQLSAIGGTVFVDKHNIFKWSCKEMAKQFAVLLTDQVRTEFLSAFEVAAMGRYPYTGLLGKLTAEDVLIVQDALRCVHGTELANKDFMTLSDGQRQRVLLARAICQAPEVLILDEPTAYLDMRHKIELVALLRRIAKEKKVTVIMSLHEIDLAAKASDYLMCVNGETITAFGTPEEIQNACPMEQLYELENGSYNSLFGSIELAAPRGEPTIFVVAGNGCGIPFYRQLQKQDIPFATGILFENDVDYQVARVLSSRVIHVPAFFRMDSFAFEQAASAMLSCCAVLDAGTPIGELNEMNGRLVALARERGIPVLKNLWET